MIKEIITDGDLELYKDTITPFGPIGCLVDTRTYRRHLPHKGRRETLLERDKRVINYLLSLVGDKLTPKEKREEGLLLLDRSVSLKAWPSSRNKWIGGTSISELDGTASFNCTLTIVNRIEAFSTIANLLMLGSGAGFRVFQSDIDNLPKLTSRPKLVVEEYNPLAAEDREEDSYYNVELDNEGSHVLYLYVGDSREGWCEVIETLIEAYTQHITYSKVIVNVDSVRPEGERLKRFGGTSSGPQALIGMLTDIERILSEIPGDSIRSIDASDMICAIAKGVIAGAQRRSALISLFDEGDHLMIRAKENLYTDSSLSHKYYRSQANNTECVGSLVHLNFIEWLLSNDPTEEEVSLWIKDTCPTKEVLIKKIESIRNSGEPGMNNYLYLIWKRYKAAKKHRVGDVRNYISAVGSNPCHRNYMWP